MLPKVANHLLQNTSRVVSAVQNAHLRNLLQNQSANNVTGWSGVGTSGNGGYGAGPGGAKYHAGSRFNGYSGPGRTLTQANSSSANDNTSGENDDDERKSIKRPSLNHSRSARTRRHSVTAISTLATGRATSESLGVLQSVQIHARHLHEFAASGWEQVELPTSEVSGSAKARRNSTSVSVKAIGDASNQTYSSEDVTTTVQESKQGTPIASIAKDIHNAAIRKESGRIEQLLNHLNDSKIALTASDLNQVLAAVSHTRAKFDSLKTILDIYNTQVQRGVRPNSSTYEIMIRLLVERELEIATEETAQLSHRNQLLPFTGDHESTQKYTSTSFLEESNFDMAMMLFQAATVVDMRLPVETYEDLLFACSSRNNLQAALEVLKELKSRTDVGVTTTAYLHMMAIYARNADLTGATDTFTAFREAAQSDRLPWNSDTQWGQFAAKQRVLYLQIYNQMISAYFAAKQPDSAVGLLASMMDSGAPIDFGPKDVPLPSAATYASIISGFCQSGDLQSATLWFDRLLQQPAQVHDPFVSSQTPLWPQSDAWMNLMETLALHAAVPELNVYVARVLQHMPSFISSEDRIIVFTANARWITGHLDMDPNELLKILNLMRLVADPKIISSSNKHCQYVAKQLADICIACGHAEFGLHIVSDVVEEHLEDIRKRAIGPDRWQLSIAAKGGFTDTVMALNTALTARTAISPALPLSVSRTLWRLNDDIGLRIGATLLDQFLLSLQSTPVPELENLTLRDWEILLAAGSAQEQADQSLTSLLLLMEKTSVQLDDVHTKISNAVADALQGMVGTPSLPLGDAYQSILRQILSDSYGSETITTPEPMDEVVPKLTLDEGLSREVEMCLSNSKMVTLETIQNLFHAISKGFQSGRVPHLSSLSKIITSLGRANATDQVQEAYRIGQHILAASESKERHEEAWLVLENAMIVAHAQAGDMDKATLHRTRIIDSGFAPSSEAYGSLIECVKDTTDDTTNAMAIFNESQSLGCVPSTYLYNNIISKLAKARRADDALKIFQQMKQSKRTQPTTVTYGAVIAACARVGDASSAERLFAEMEKNSRKALRIPPFNTMIQFFTNTKPNRARALHYYNKLRERNISPTAHTYKLLIDAYGAIEPVDSRAMQRVFDDLVEVMPPQGTHWAALINSYGCVQKDLDKALTVFHSIRDHPSTIRHKRSLPDGIVYEALFLAIVMHKRMDLVEKYLHAMAAEDVHMTAYIANLLIKGHAMNKDLPAARSVFESLKDPAQGVAAPNNHAVKGEQSQAQLKVPASEPSYREPSTWEAMIRAEYGEGNHEAVENLIHRLHTRQFPAGVVNRITGIVNGGDIPELQGYSADRTRPTF